MAHGHLSSFFFESGRKPEIHIHPLISADIRRHPPKSGDLKQYGPWAAHFRAVHHAVAGDPGFKKQARALLTKAKSDTKTADKALARIEKQGVKAFSAAVKSWQKATLAERYTDLQDTLIRLKDQPRINTKAKADFEKVLAERARLDETGAAQAVSATQGALEQWKGEQGR